MGKRFTDTAIWSKPWFRKLTPGEKCAFSYIKDNCDNVGVWVPDFELADFVIGQKIEWEELLEHCNGNIRVLENGKWLLTDFCDFQYGELSKDCMPHRSYIRLLQKHGLPLRVSQEYSKGSNTHKEKEEEKEKEKEEEKDLKNEQFLPLAQLLADLIERNDSRFFKRRDKAKTVQKWSNDLRLLVEADGYPVAEVETVIRWCQNDDFWKSNILSGGKLRDQFPRLRMQAEKNGGLARASPKSQPYGKCPTCGAKAIKTNAGLLCTNPKCRVGR